MRNFSDSRRALGKFRPQFAAVCQCLVKSVNSLVKLENVNEQGARL